MVTVHDCISIEYKYRGDPRLPAYVRMMDCLLRRAEAVVAISQATRHAIVRNFSLLPEQIVVIPSGTEPLNATPAPIVTTRPFVLWVTNTLPHKNTRAVCRAWSRCRAPREGVELLVVGQLNDDLQSLCRRAAAPLRVLHDVDDETLAALYRNCMFLIAPSLSEGHDLPVAEALAAGARVLCSDIEVHREYYDGQVRFFDPFREEAIVSALNDSLNMPWLSLSTTRRVPRNFADVAADYVALFRRIEARNG